MPRCHRVGDIDTAEAPVTESLNKTVFVNGILAAVDGSPVQGHGIIPHSDPVTANGAQSVYFYGLPVNYIGNPDSCGHRRDPSTGSPNVFIEGI